MVKWGLWLDSLCPFCKMAPETLRHLLQCPHPTCSDLRKQRSQDLQSTLLQLRLPPLWPPLLQCAFYPDHAPESFLSPPTFQAYLDQHSLGLEWTALGFISTLWRRLFARQVAQGHFSVGNPQIWLTALLHNLWQGAWGIWKERNALHQTEKDVRRHANLLQQVGEIQSHSPTAFHPAVRHHLSETVEELTSKPDAYIRAWVASLSIHNT